MSLIHRTAAARTAASAIRECGNRAAAATFPSLPSSPPPPSSSSSTSVATGPITLAYLRRVESGNLRIDDDQLATASVLDDLHGALMNRVERIGVPDRYAEALAAHYGGGGGGGATAPEDGGGGGGQRRGGY
jgi:hypothetical protein